LTLHEDWMFFSGLMIVFSDGNEGPLSKF